MQNPRASAFGKKEIAMKRLMAVLVGLGMLGAMTLAGCRAGVAVEPNQSTSVAMPR